MAFGPPTKNLFKKITSSISGAFGLGEIMFDPTGDVAKKTSIQQNGPTKIMEGVVLRSGLLGYDCLVKIGMFGVPCNIISRQSSQAFGTSNSEIPVEGSNVLVYLPYGNYNMGYILGTVPRSQILVPNSDYVVRPPAHYPNEDILPYEDNIAYNVPYKDPMYVRKLFSWANRNSDIHPGESLTENENHTGLLTAMYGAEVTAGDSFVRVDRLDDSIRERCTNFTHWSNQRACSEFNDGGHISAEGRYYSYQGELLAKEGHTGPHYEKPNDTKDKEPRPRIRFWKSFLGNLISYFVVRARKSKGDFDTTLASLHVSQAGNVIVKAGGGVSLERYERIPTPKRLLHAWDPKGDREKDCPHAPFKPFKVKVPHDRGLAEASKMAWEVKTLYQRWDELTKDFKVQNEDEVKLPQDDDEDPKHSNEIKYSEYRDRHAGIFIGDDGSIILRDTWGSEIVMLGGNILINTPGNVITTANKDIVSIARQTLAMRGTESAELSSEEQHVRIHAKKLVEIAGGTDVDPGGVLIEALGEGKMTGAPEEAGRDALIYGVVVKAEKSGVALGARDTYVTAEHNVFVKSYTENVFVDADKYVASTGNSGVINVSHESLCYVSEDSCVLASPGSSLVTGGSAMIVNGDQVPMLWVDVSADFNELYQAALGIFESLQSDDITVPYSWDDLKEQALFSFRNSLQGLTNRGIEPWRPNGPFTLYEPWWQVMKDYGDPNIEKAQPYHPVAEEVHSTKCWPYKESIEGGVFKKCPKPVNLDVWWSKPRKGLQDEEVIVEDSMGNFKV